VRPILCCLLFVLIGCGASKPDASPTPEAPTEEAAPTEAAAPEVDQATDPAEAAAPADAEAPAEGAEPADGAAPAGADGATPTDDGDAAETVATEGAAGGESCLAPSDCASGICEGQGCTADQPGTCRGERQPCTRDRRPFCSCDGEQFFGSSSCPGQRYDKQGPC
jgi:hypothetical protein